MRVKWADLGLAGDTAAVRDVWTAKDLGTIQGGYDQTVPAQDGVLLIVKGTEGPFSHYEPTAKQTQEDAKALDGKTRFTVAAAPEDAWAQARITYVNSGAETHLVAMKVNEQAATWVAFPPTGASRGSVWVQVRLDRTDTGNQTGNLLTFATRSGDAVTIDSIDVH